MAHLDNPLLIHVAAEAEDRGRVVLAARSGAPHRIAISAAVAVAQAFDAWLECLIIEDPHVFALTEHGFAREVTHAGRIMPLSLTVHAENRTAETANARRVLQAATAGGSVRVETTVVRQALLEALASACAARGPWNIIGLAEPVQAGDGRWLHHLLSNVSGATGVVLVGPRAASGGGPVTVVVEDVERLPQMLRAAQRLAERPDGNGAGRIVLLLAGETAGQIRELEGHVRLVLPEAGAPGRASIEIAAAGIAHGTPSEAAEALRQSDSGLVIARNGGLVVPPDGDIAALTLALRCPLLLVR